MRLLTVFYLVYCLQYSLIWVEPRYATPVNPLLLALGLCGLPGLLAAVRRERSAE